MNVPPKILFGLSERTGGFISFAIGSFCCGDIRAQSVPMRLRFAASDAVRRMGFRRMIRLLAVQTIRATLAALASRAIFSWPIAEIFLVSPGHRDILRKGKSRPFGRLMRDGILQTFRLCGGLYSASGRTTELRQAPRFP